MFAAGMVMNSCTLVPGHEGFVFILSSSHDPQCPFCARDWITVIDNATGAVMTTIKGFQSLHGEAVTPDGSRIYVVDSEFAGAEGGHGSLYVIDAHQFNMIAKINPVGNCDAGCSPFNPQGVAVSPDGQKLYVTLECSTGEGSELGAISVIDATSYRVLNTFHTFYDDAPSAVAVTPDGTKVHIANNALARSALPMSVLETINGTLNTLNGLPQVFDAYSLAITWDGKKLYATDPEDGLLQVVDTATDNILKTIHLGVPGGVTISPLRDKVFVTDGFTGAIQVIDTTTDTLRTTLSVGSGSVSGIDATLLGLRVYAPLTNPDSLLIIGDEGPGNWNFSETAVPAGNSPAAYGSFITVSH
jgi:YVTN family beta-propeller protein